MAGAANGGLQDEQAKRSEGMTLTQQQMKSVISRTYGNKRREGYGHRDAVVNTKIDIEHMLHGTGVTVNNADIEEVCRKEKRREAGKFTRPGKYD